MTTAHIDIDPALQPVDWQAIDDATQAWVASVLGLTVNWENQNVPQPAYPYVTLLRNPETDEGGINEIRNRTVDANGDVINPGDPGTPDANEAIIFQPIQWTLSATAHTDFGNGGNDPAANAVARLGKLKRSLGLESTTDAFTAVGVSIVSPEEIVDSTLVINGEWISKATLDVIFRTASVMTEAQSFIDKVNLVSTQLGVDVVIDAS